MTNDAPAQASVEAVARVIYKEMGFSYEGRTVNAMGIPYGSWAKALKAAEAVLALSPPPTVGAEDEASLFHVTGERITRKDLNNAYRSGQENGRLAAHLLDGVRRHHDPSCALWGDLPADCDCSLSGEPVSCIASEKGE